MPQILVGRRAAASVGLFSFPFLLFGCGPANDLGGEPVVGTVTLDGQPLDQGSIFFTPAIGDASGRGTAITAGAYEIAAENGVPPGRYVVRINSVGGGPGDPNMMPGESKPAKERVPKSWNSQSKHEVEVVAGGSTLPFDIKSTD